jgi:hypothetical protein
MNVSSYFPLVIFGFLSASCGVTDHLSGSVSDLSGSLNTHMLSDVPVAARPRVGDSYIWAYYPGGGTKPRMYEGYIQLRGLKGRPTIAMVTLFPEEAPAEKWILHDGIGFDYDQVVAAYASPEGDRQPHEQMFGWDDGRKKWFPSTNRPNTSANSEKFNYRRKVIRTDTLAWQTIFGCYDSMEVRPVDRSTGECAAGEVVFQQLPRNNPGYVFHPFYSLATGVTIFKRFNDDSTDPDARVSMRLLYQNDIHGETLIGERLLPARYLASFKSTIRDILARDSE